MNTISPLSSSTFLGSATSRFEGQSNPQQGAQPGEIFKAVVLEAQGKDTFLIDINGENVTAQSKAPLSPGQNLQLQLVSTSPQVELQIVSSPQQQFFGRSLTLVGENINLSNLLEGLQGGVSSTQGTTATVLAAEGDGAYVVDIGGHPVQAQSSIPLSPGQPLQVSADPVSLQAQLNTTAGPSQQATFSIAPDTAPGVLTNLLQSPSPLQAQVTAATQAQNQYLSALDIGGTRVQIQGQAPLTPGQSLQVQVDIASLQLQFNTAAAGQQQASGGILTLAGQAAGNIFLALQQPVNPLFDNLSSAAQSAINSFQTLQQNNLSGAEGGKTLKQLIDTIGLSLEHQLATGDSAGAAKTLKAALLEAAYVFKDSADTSDAAHRLLGTVEVYQMAQQHLGDTGTFVAPLPLPFLEQGYLTVEGYGGQKEGETEENGHPLSFSLHLAMSDLGNLRIDFLQYQNGLYIRFNTDSKEKSDFVASFSTDLENSLSGVPLLGLTFSDTAADPTTDLIKKLLPQGASILDTKI
jgi:hypothetical protein